MTKKVAIAFLKHSFHHLTIFGLIAQVHCLSSAFGIGFNFVTFVEPSLSQLLELRTLLQIALCYVIACNRSTNYFTIDIVF